jgi:integrase
MAEARLTKIVVDKLQPAAKEYVLWCGKLPGFGCRVRTSGTKTFIVQFRVGGRNSPIRKKTLGTYGKVTVEQARKYAEKYLASAELGEDLVANQAKARTEITISQLCDEYLKRGMDLKKASTVATDRARIERHIRPLLGSKRIGAITSADIEIFMRDVAAGKTARDVKTERGRSIVTGGKGTATRTVRLLGGILSYAVRHNYLRHNPRQGVKLYPDQKGERYLSADELTRLSDALHEAETVGLPWTFNEGSKKKHRPKLDENQREKFSPHVTAAVRLLLLTGCRLREILNLRWNEVDFERGLLNLSDSKTGKKSVFLAAAAIEILSALPKNGAYVIAGNNPNRPRSDLKRPWQRIVAHAGLSNFRIHDLRHTFASLAVGSGVGLATVGRLCQSNLRSCADAAARPDLSGH